MSYSCLISFKKIKAKDINDFFIEMKRVAKSNLDSIAEQNFHYSPIHRELFLSDLQDEIDNKTLYKKLFTEQEEWVKRIFTYRWFYIKEHQLLGVFGIPNSLYSLFDSTVYFQNSTDQDYDFSNWDNVDLFKGIADKYRNLDLDGIVQLCDWYTKEELQENGQLDYMRKTLCYKEIWDTYLDDKLYDKSKGIYLSLLSPFYDDIGFVVDFANITYKKSLDYLTNINLNYDTDKSRE